MKRFLSAAAILTAAVMMLLCFTACGGSDSDNAGNNEAAKADITGTWNLTISADKVMAMPDDSDNFTDAQTKVYGVLKERLKEITVSGTITFREDGTYAGAYDQQSIDTVTDIARKTIKEYLYELVEGSGFSREEFQEYLDTAGMTEDEYVERSTPDPSEKAKSEGTYRLDGDKLYTARGDAALTDSRYFLIEMTASELTFKQAFGDDGKSLMSNDKLPMTLTRP